MRTISKRTIGAIIICTGLLFIVQGAYAAGAKNDKEKYDLEYATTSAEAISQHSQNKEVRPIGYLYYEDGRVQVGTFNTLSNSGEAVGTSVSSDSPLSITEGETNESGDANLDDATPGTQQAPKPDESNGGDQTEKPSDTGRSGFEPLGPISEER